MLIWFLGAMCIVASLYVTGARVLSPRFILGYATAVDVVFTLGMLVLFRGSVTGLMSATLAGLLLAISLSAGRYLFGYKRLRIVRYKHRVGIAVVETPGKMEEIADWYRYWMIRTMTGVASRCGQ